jgi:hypothetical protein
MRKAKEAWDKVKRLLEYAHLFEYLAHPAHSDLITMLLFALRWPVGWAALGWLIAAYLFFRPVQSDPPRRPRRKKANRNHAKCKPPKPESRKPRVLKPRRTVKRKDD